VSEAVDWDEHDRKAAEARAKLTMFGPIWVTHAEYRIISAAWDQARSAEGDQIREEAFD
jgi:hypothetical protein